MTRRAMEWAALLYPAAWRHRYGAEFRALIEDSGGGWREFIDVVKGAIGMQLRSGNVWKWVAACGLIGAVAAGIATWMTPKTYVSTAVLRLTPRGMPEGGWTVNDRNAGVSRLNNIEQEVLSRTSLAEIIMDPALELYKRERAERPMEDIVMEMRTHDIAIRPVRIPAGSSAGPFAFSISYVGDTPERTQAVTRSLVAKFVDEHVQVARAGAGTGAGETLEVLDPPSLPYRPTQPRIASWIGTGLLLGALLGVTIVGVRRWPIVAGAAIAGALIAGGISMLVPREYISMAVVRGEGLRNAQSVVSEPALQRMIADLKLYPNERDRNGLAGRMRGQIQIRAIRPPGTLQDGTPVASVSFRYSDKYVAQAVTAGLVRALRESGPSLEVLDPPSDPVQPVSPIAGRWIACGLLAGLLGGIVFTWQRGRKQLAPAAA